ncbi:MAG: head GIN domain-containing protein [Ginsengibacter sp.]
MKPFLLFLFAIISIQSNAQTVINDKNVQVRNVSSFSAIKVSGGIDVYLSQSNENAVAVSASDDVYRDNIKTEVENGVLNIYYDNNSFRFNSNKKLRAYVSFKTLESIEGSGACDFIIAGTLKLNSLKVKLSGACDMKGIVNITNAQLDISGASTLKINGQIQNLKLEANGASDLKNYDLVVDNFIAQLSGASDAKLTVNKSISAKASGASTLYFKGNPEVRNVSSSGASNISNRD